jgi:hypothetical protein
MARPGSVFSWGSSAPITTPTGGKIAAGFAPQERGAAQYFNWGWNLIGQWITWLAAGVMDGNWEFTGNVKVDGTTHLVGNTTEDGTLTVTGAAHLNGGLDHSDNWTYAVPLGGAWYMGNCTTGTSLDRSIHQQSGTPWHYQTIDAGAWGLRTGDRIKTVSARFSANTGAQWTLSLYAQDNSVAGTTPTLIQQIVHTSVMVSGVEDVTFTVSSPSPIQAQQQWFIAVDGTGVGDLLQALWVDADHPS